MEKLCHLGLELHRDSGKLAEGKDPLKGKCCSVLRLRDALTIAGACASVFMA